MKKTILILVITGMMFSSCSSDDDGNLPLTLGNISGNWKVESVVKPDGTIEPYVNSCNQQSDYIQFYTYYKMEFHQFNTDCEPSYMYETCTDYYFLEGGIISNCGNLVDGKVTVLKRNKMQIDYEEVRNFPYFDNNLVQVEGIILTRE